MRSINLFIIAASLLLISCKKKKDDDTTVVSDNISNGMIVLCEGLFQQNNSTVSWVDFSTGQIANNMFEQKTDRSLGDTGNDLLEYGGKIYIAVNVSSTIEVMEAATFKSLKQINMEAGGVSKQPRFMIGVGSNVFISCYDGFVDVLDTASLTITQRIQVGSNPENLRVSNNKLYVANSGGLNYPVMDSTVSVIDLSTMTELYKITVGLNPGDVEVDNNGDVYVITRGDYGTVLSRMVKIDPVADMVVQQFSFDASEIAPYTSGYMLVSYADFSSGANQIGLFNTGTESMENATMLDLSNVQTAYEVKYIASKNRIYIMDAMDFTTTGYVHEFATSGNLIQSFHVGLNPTDLIVYE